MNDYCGGMKVGGAGTSGPAGLAIYAMGNLCDIIDSSTPSMKKEPKPDPNRKTTPLPASVTICEECLLKDDK